MVEKHKLQTYNNTVLRVIASIMIIGIICILFSSFVVSYFSSIGAKGTDFKEGYFDIGNTKLEAAAPLMLNGTWDCFPGLYMPKDGYNEERLSTGGTEATLPIETLSETTDDVTYRMRLKIQHLPEDQLVFYIPMPKNKINVFLNGKALHSSKHNPNWLNYSTYDSIFYADTFDPNLKWQEIVISVKYHAGNDGLFNREIVLSTLRNVISLEMVAMGSEMLILGMLLLMLISGFIFMAFRPNHKMITAMTVFDSLLMARIIMSLKYVRTVVENLYFDRTINDGMYQSLQIFFLMTAGIAGIVLAGNLFDPEKKTPKWLSRPPAYIYAVFAIVFPLNLELFDKIGTQLILLNFIYTFMGVACQVYFCLRKQRTTYYVLQAIKTTFIGLVVLWDIYSWNSHSSELLRILLYCMFFIAHLGFRLYDNNSSYQQVEALNRDLEQTVFERTQALEKANAHLQEIAIRDPMTGAFNRLEFQQQMEKYFLSYEIEGKDVYLCIFDLDCFKRINDHFGHDEGDRQLIAAVDICQGMIPPQAVLSRIGGEEFAVLLKGQSDLQILLWAEELRQVMEVEAKSSERKTTISIGVTKCQRGMDKQSLFKWADNCLYAAKNNGRNKIYYNFDGKEQCYQKELN